MNDIDGVFKYTEVHFLMNLPQIAIEFLGTFISQRWFNDSDDSNYIN